MYWTALNITQQAPNVQNKIFSTVVGAAERNLTRNQPSILNKLFR